MATWIAHLRVAEKLIEMGLVEESEGFILGNIAPDSGVPNAARSSFEPPKTVTHWMVGDCINYQGFKEEHLRSVNPGREDYDSSFRLGYYVHLLCDEMWGVLFKRKLQDPLYKVSLDKDPSFIWTIKKDWYGQDVWYLQDNPDALFFRRFQHLTDVREVLPYLPAGAVAAQLQYIKDYYLTRLPEFTSDRPWVYLSRGEMDTYVAEATEFCAEKIRECAVAAK